MSEYLGGFNSNLFENWHWQEMVEKNQVIDPVTLRSCLQEAFIYLTTEPGPNLERRKQLAPTWLGWWIRHLKNKTETSNVATIASLETIPVILGKDLQKPSGVLFVGGGEGHGGHRWAVNWMMRFVKPVLLFEQENYFKDKERGEQFLPLEVRLSMWSYYESNMIISVLPQRDEEISLTDHYQPIFDKTGADYCFAAEGDPYGGEKRSRGKQARFTLIPYLPVPSTTDRVQKLFPD